MDRWPEPGTVAASPAAAIREVEQVYGPVGQIIRPEGLGSPTEPLVYVRLGEGVKVLEGTWLEAVRFGNRFTVEVSSEQLRSPPLYSVQLMLGIFLVLPALTFLASALRIGASRRSAHAAVLEVLGADRKLLWRLAARDVAPGAAAGTACALACLAGAYGWGVHLGIGVVSATDIRANAPLILSCILATCALASLAAFIAAVPPRVQRAARPRARAAKYPIWLAMIGALLIVGVGVVAISSATASDPLSSGWFMLAVALTVVFAGPIAGALLVSAGKWLAKRGWQKARALPLIVGRELEASPRDAVRLAAVGVVTIVVISAASFVISLGQQNAREAEQAFAAAHGKAALVYGTSELSSEDYGVMKSALPPGAFQLALEIEPPSGGKGKINAQITGRAEELKALGLSPGAFAWDDVPNAVLKPLLRAGFGVQGEVRVLEGEPRVTAHTGAQIANTRTLLLVSKPGVELDILAIQGKLNSVLAPGIDVDIPGSEWRDGGRASHVKSLWIILFGVAGGICLVVAAWLNASADLSRSARRLGVVALLAGSERSARRAIGMRVFLIAATAVCVGSLIAWHLSWVAVVQGLSAREGLIAVAILAGVTAAAATVAARVGQTEVKRAVANWRPGSEVPGE